MSQIPANVKPGDFYLVSFDGKNPNIKETGKWLKHGGAIRLAQFVAGEGFSQYEHAGIYVGNGKVIEASNGGTVVTDWHYDDQDVEWSSGIIEPTVEQRLKIVNAAYGYVGTPYSWPDYAAIAAKKLHLLPATKNLKDYVATSKHMICSQLVDQVYQDAGYHLFDDGRWPGYVMPGSLHNLLAEKSKK
jgi:cell wall-associated NlpC family hydrolase